MQLAGYSDIKEFSRYGHYLTLQARDNTSGNLVTIKLLPEAGSKIDQVIQLRHEYEILNRIRHPKIPLPIDLKTVDQQFMLIKEFKQGLTLKDFIRLREPTLSEKLHIAHQIFRILDHLHQNSIIHKNITPYHILIDSASLEVSIIDFGLASILSAENQAFVPITLLEENLTYCAPEQTGRVKRRIDYRTDYYGFGNTLYELFTSQPPFPSKDPLELVHAQLARLPPPPHVIVPGLPEVITDIVFKCIAKNPDDRYQSASGLNADLEKCIAGVKAKGTIDPFEIGKEETYDRFQIPQRLYGREQETRILSGAFDKVPGNAPQLVLVSGYSGIGKTALIAEIYKPVTRSKGIFLKGKADQMQRSSPYAALIQAFEDFADFVLKESEEGFLYWKRKIKKAIGDNAPILLEAAPKLALITGPADTTPESAPTEIELRFNQVIYDFLDAIADPDHPLVLFLDDLQWVDQGTLKLIDHLVKWQSPENLMIIGAYRDNEVSPTHPLQILVEKLRRSKHPPTEINLKPLTTSDVTHLVADTLRLPTEKTVKLAELIHAKTLGNPFFTIQLLTTLQEEQYLHFNPDTKQWQWNLEDIINLHVSDNVVELMVRKIGSLPPDTMEMLKYAACIGNAFTWQLLSTISGSNFLETFNRLKPAFLDRYIVPPGHVYRTILLMDNEKDLERLLKQSALFGDPFYFVHDRIQQAAYLLIPEEDRAKIHLGIARSMLEQNSGEEVEEQLFDVVHQFGKGLDLISDQAEKTFVAELNLQAGERAKHANALQLARDYFETAIDLLPSDAWTKHYDTTWKLHEGLAETLSLSGAHEEAEQYFKRVEKRTKTPLERLKLSRVRCNLYTKTHHYYEALHVAHKTLEEFGIRFPKNRLAQKISALKKVFTSWIMLKRKVKTWEALAHLPISEDPVHIAITDLITETGVAAYSTNQEMMVMSMLETLRLSLRKGMTGSGTWSLMSFAVIIGSNFGKHETGYRIGQATLKLCERACSKVQYWKTSIVPPAFLNHWVKPRVQNIEQFWDIFRGCVENGEQVMASTSLIFDTTMSLAAGIPLDSVRETIEKNKRLQIQINSDHGLLILAPWQQYVKSMRGQTNAFGAMDDAAFNEAAYVRKLSETDSSDSFTTQAHYHIARLLTLFFACDLKTALQTGKKLEKLESFQLGLITVPEYVFFYALTITQAILRGIARPAKWRGTLKRLTKRVRRWSTFSPENFQHQYDLIRAETLAINGKDYAASAYYEKAISGAAENLFYHHQAISFELAGHAFYRQDKQHLGDVYMHKAWLAYGKWGALAKQQALIDQFPQIDAHLGDQEAIPFQVDATSGAQPSLEDQLNLSSLLKASQSLASEIKLDQLMEKLMHILLENAAAEKACLILHENGRSRLVAESVTEGQHIRSLEENLGQYSSRLPVSVVNYCLHSRAPIVLDQASQQGMFTEDPYIKRRQVASILCFPIMHQNKLMGLIYLENNLVNGAFTADRIEVLRLLSSQIAISLENALLYENLELKVFERTRQIEQQKEEIEAQKRKADTLLLNILPSETAEELKAKGKSTPKYYPMVTVMFTDFIGFTKIAERMEPETLVSELDSFFRKFDQIIEKYGIEKIKTIGDAYMCVSGLPITDPDHALRMIDAALEISTFMHQDRLRRKREGNDIFRIRIGIHSGPVVAGIVGSKKFAFDIWGDTVNVAARMENACEDGRINISSDTHALVRDKYACEYRGKLPVKHKGEIEMYYVEDMLNVEY